MSGTVFSVAQRCSIFGGGGVMEIFSKEIPVGNIIIELSIQEINGSKRVVITAKDDQHRRLWRTPILVNGEIKTYESNQDAIDDAEKKVASAYIV